MPYYKPEPPSVAEESNQVAIYNSAAQCIERLNKILGKAQESFVSGHENQIIMYERALYRELSSKLKEVELEVARKEFEILGRLLKIKSVLRIRLKNIVFGDTTEIRIALNNYTERTFIQLERIDMMLRRFAEKKGLLLPNKQESSNIFD